MVKFEIRNDEIELVEYSDDAALSELSGELENFRQLKGLKTDNCKGCEGCCSDDIPVLGFDLPRFDPDNDLIIPEKPDLDTRKKGIRDLENNSMNNSMNHEEATLIYEYNNSEPVILKKKQDGECIFLENGLCGHYKTRPYSCGLYLCNMGEHLSFLQEMIIRQGTWHAYNVMGWIDQKDIAHNPFFKADSYDKLLIKDFDYDLKNALEHLFFYF